MTYTPPEDTDLTALDQTAIHLRETADYLMDAAGVLTLVHDRIAVVQPPPPPPPPPAAALPRVGVGGSGAFGGLTPERQTEVLLLMKACGITEFRMDCQWQGIEYARGKYAVANYVQRAQRVIDAGLELMVLVGWTAKPYRANATDPNSAPRDNDESRLAWEAFLRELMPALYAIGVRRFEIWNEPNGLFMQPVSPALWADLVLIANMVAADISRHIVIVSGGVCPRPNTPPTSLNASNFYDAVIAHEPDFFRYVDECGIHPYAGDHTALKSGAFWKTHVAHIATLKPAEVPFCGTEHGWKSGRNTEAERTALYVDTVTSWTEKAPVYVFSAFDFAELYGLVSSASTGLRPKPVYDALKKLLVRE